MYWLSLHNYNPLDTELFPPNSFVSLACLFQYWTYCRWLTNWLHRLKKGFNTNKIELRSAGGRFKFRRTLAKWLELKTIPSRLFLINDWNHSQQMRETEPRNKESFKSHHIEFIRLNTCKWIYFVWKFRQSVTIVIVKVNFHGEVPEMFKCCYAPILEQYTELPTLKFYYISKSKCVKRTWCLQT